MCRSWTMITTVQHVIDSQAMTLDVHSSRPKRRSDDGQTILKPDSIGSQSVADLRRLVELRGLEPLASCMPFLAIPSGTVAGSRMPAVQSRCAVRMCPSLPAAVWVRSHLISHWFAGLTGEGEVSSWFKLPGQATLISP